MNEDDGENGSGRGKSFPENQSGSTENVVPFVRGKSVPAPGSKKRIKPVTRSFWSPDEIEFLRLALQSYMHDHELTPQKLYDEIMEPEIDAKIVQSKEQDGITLSRVQARPDQDGRGRDIIRNWVTRPPHAISHSFLKYAQRFADQNGLTGKATELSMEAAQSRKEYHIRALKSIFADIDFSPVPIDEFCFDGQCTFAILVGRRKPGGLISIWFDDDLTGHFVIVRPKDLTNIELFHDAVENEQPIDTDDLILAYRGYVIPHYIHEPPKNGQFEVVFSVMFVETFEPALAEGLNFVTPTKKHMVPFQNSLTIRCQAGEPRRERTRLLPISLDNMDGTIPEEFSFIGKSTVAIRLSPILHKDMSSLEKFAFLGKNA